MRRVRNTPIQTKPSFAIVVDGDCEVWYLQMLKRNERSIAINIDPKIPHRKKLSEQYISVLNFSKVYTKVFWIIDFDVISNETKKAKKGSKTILQEFENYINDIKQNYENVIILVNNPCLKFWFLLHFEDTSRLFTNCIEVEKQLKKYLKNYEKTQKYYTKQDKDIYLVLKPKLRDALKNAKKLGQFNIKDSNKAMTEMQLFFETVEFGKLFI
jgi:SNF2 family DNA or RNA helicase